MTTAERLRQLMVEYSLTRAMVAEILAVGESTVDSWLAPERAPWHRNMPEQMLELMIYKLKEM